ncbi:hypothetical protein BYT27DRAFT_7183288 [Phlegmacium glaucopus]|nr:hypothetical protein BYT27DRAFT_7183288 [Phlegmacium glaucopus]
MVDGNSSVNATIVNQSPADLKLKNTINSPQMQNGDLDTQMMNDGQATYCFHNCGTVYVDSFNARNVKTENCGNYAPQVNYHRIGSEPLCQQCQQGLYPQLYVVVNGTSPTHTSFSVGYIVLLASLAAVSCLAVFICPVQCLSWLCGIGWGKRGPSLPRHWQDAGKRFQV